MTRWFSSALALAMFLVAGCTAAPPQATIPAPEPPPTASAPAVPMTTPAQQVLNDPSKSGAEAAAKPSSKTGCLAQAPTPPATAKKHTVTRVVDGDTVDLSNGTRTRILGVNTPETKDPRKPVEYYGKEASAFTEKMLTGQTVLIQPGTQPTDRYGRLLAWIWLEDGRFYNALLVAEGFAQVATYSDNPEHADMLRLCQREAMEAKRGLWADASAGAETPAAPVAPAPGTAPAPVPAEGATVIKEPGTVAAGGNATVSVRTAPGATCSITVTYKSGPSKAQGLSPKRADATGAASWSWVVGRNTTPGTWPVTINCEGRSLETAVTVR